MLHPNQPTQKGRKNHKPVFPAPILPLSHTFRLHEHRPYPLPSCTKRSSLEIPVHIPFSQYQPASCHCRASVSPGSFHMRSHSVPLTLISWCLWTQTPSTTVHALLKQNIEGQDALGTRTYFIGAQCKAIPWIHGLPVHPQTSLYMSSGKESASEKSPDPLSRYSP